MGRFLISADSHVMEPLDLWTGHLPEHLRSQGPRIDLRDDVVCMMVEDTVVRRFSSLQRFLGPDAGEERVDLVQAADAQERSGMVSMGASDPEGRLRDLDADGVWGEVI